MCSWRQTRNLTHWGLVAHICVGNLTIVGSDQCWNIVNCIRKNKLQWNFNWNSNSFFEENAFEKVVCEMVAICLGFNVLTLYTQYILTTEHHAPMTYLYNFYIICHWGDVLQYNKGNFHYRNNSKFRNFASFKLLLFTFLELCLFSSFTLLFIYAVCSWKRAVIMFKS